MAAAELVGVTVAAQATAAEQKHGAVAVVAAVVVVDAQTEHPGVEATSPKQASSEGMEAAV